MGHGGQTQFDFSDFHELIQKSEMSKGVTSGSQCGSFNDSHHCKETGRSHLTAAAASALPSAGALAGR